MSTVGCRVRRPRGSRLGTLSDGETRARIGDTTISRGKPTLLQGRNPSKQVVLSFVVLCQDLPAAVAANGRLKRPAAACGMFRVSAMTKAPPVYAHRLGSDYGPESSRRALER